jgi:hypothetical protein
MICKFANENIYKEIKLCDINPEMVFEISLLSVEMVISIYNY